MHSGVDASHNSQQDLNDLKLYQVISLNGTLANGLNYGIYQ